MKKKIFADFDHVTKRAMSLLLSLLFVAGDGMAPQVLAADSTTLDTTAYVWKRVVGFEDLPCDDLWHPIIVSYRDYADNQKKSGNYTDYYVNTTGSKLDLTFSGKNKLKDNQGNERNWALNAQKWPDSFPSLDYTYSGDTEFYTIGNNLTDWGIYHCSYPTDQEEYAALNFFISRGVDFSKNVGKTGTQGKWTDGRNYKGKKDTDAAKNYHDAMVKKVVDTGAKWFLSVGTGSTKDAAAFYEYDSNNKEMLYGYENGTWVYYYSKGAMWDIVTYDMNMAFPTMDPIEEKGVITAPDSSCTSITAYYNWLGAYTEKGFERIVFRVDNGSDIIMKHKNNQVYMDWTNDTASEDDQFVLWVGTPVELRDVESEIFGDEVRYVENGADNSLDTMMLEWKKVYSYKDLPCDDMWHPILISYREYEDSKKKTGSYTDYYIDTRGLPLGRTFGGVGDNIGGTWQYCGIRAQKWLNIGAEGYYPSLMPSLLEGDSFYTLGEPPSDLAYYRTREARNTHGEASCNVFISRGYDFRNSYSQTPTVVDNWNDGRNYGNSYDKKDAAKNREALQYYNDLTNQLTDTGVHWFLGSPNAKGEAFFLDMNDSADEKWTVPYHYDTEAKSSFSADSSLNRYQGGLTWSILTDDIDDLKLTDDKKKQKEAEKDLEQEVRANRFASDPNLEYGEVYINYTCVSNSGFVPDGETSIAMKHKDDTVYFENVAWDKNSYDNGDFILWVGTPVKFGTLRELESGGSSNTDIVRSGLLLNLEDPMIIEEGHKLIVEPGAVLSISTDLYNNGIIENYGTVVVQPCASIRTLFPNELRRAIRQEGDTLGNLIAAASRTDGPKKTSNFSQLCGEIRCRGGTYNGMAAEGNLIVMRDAGIIFDEGPNLLQLEQGATMEINGTVICPNSLRLFDSDLYIRSNGTLYCQYEPEYHQTSANLYGKVTVSRLNDVFSGDWRAMAEMEEFVRGNITLLSYICDSVSFQAMKARFQDASDPLRSKFLEEVEMNASIVDEFLALGWLEEKKTRSKDVFNEWDEYSSAYATFLNRDIFSISPSRMTDIAANRLILMCNYKMLPTLPGAPVKKADKLSTVSVYVCGDYQFINDGDFQNCGAPIRRIDISSGTSTSITEVRGQGSSSEMKPTSESGEWTEEVNAGGVIRIVHASDGSYTIYYEDGTAILHNNDGTTVETCDSGAKVTQIRRGADGWYAMYKSKPFQISEYSKVVKSGYASIDEYLAATFSEDRKSDEINSWWSYTRQYTDASRTTLVSEGHFRHGSGAGSLMDVFVTYYYRDGECKAGEATVEHRNGTVDVYTFTGEPGEEKLGAKIGTIVKTVNSSGQAFTQESTACTCKNAEGETVEASREVLTTQERRESTLVTGGRTLPLSTEYTDGKFAGIQITYTTLTEDLTALGNYYYSQVSPDVLKSDEAYKTLWRLEDGKRVFACRCRWNSKTESFEYFAGYISKTTYDSLKNPSATVTTKDWKDDYLSNSNLWLGKKALSVMPDPDDFLRGWPY